MLSRDLSVSSVPLNNPLPKSLEHECKKAARILNSFTIPSAEKGPDSLIPSRIITGAKGLAILTVFKAGFLISIRAGSGIVIAKLPDGHWSAPAAIGVAGLGGGFEIGAELTDFVIVLNSQGAVEAFSKGGNLTLGGNFSVALGPVGRNAEADVSVRSPSAIYTYSKTRGLFAGISLEGSGIVERKDANRKFYGTEVRSRELLSGNYPPPDEAYTLYKALENQEKRNLMTLESVGKTVKRLGSISGVPIGAAASYTKSHQDMLKKKEKQLLSKSRERSSSLSSYSSKVTKVTTATKSKAATDYKQLSLSPKDRSRKEVLRDKQFSSSPKDISRKVLQATSTSSAEDDPTVADWDAKVYVRALFTFRGQMDCDLTFKKGDKFELITRTSKQFDWWEGKTEDGKKGIFPANYVKII